MKIPDQNSAFVEAARAGAQLPSYQWATGAPNCPALPSNPAALHMAELDRKIAARVESMINQARTNLNIGRPAFSQAEINQEIREAEAAIATAERYGNDVTRLPAFVELAALHKFQQVAPGVQPTQLKR